jgi:hypothetical protein
MANTIITRWRVRSALLMVQHAIDPKTTAVMPTAIAAGHPVTVAPATAPAAAVTVDLTALTAPVPDQHWRVSGLAEAVPKKAERELRISVAPGVFAP